MRSRFLFKLFVSYALLVLVNALLVDFLVSRWAERDERHEIEETLGAQALLLADAVRPHGAAEGGGALQRRMEELGATTGSRFTVVAPDGRVLADSAERPEEMQNHLERPEFVAARARGRGSDERVSATTGLRTLYVCLAVSGGAEGIGYVRASLPLPGLEARLDRIRQTVVAGVAIGTAVALALALFVARRLTRPLAEMTQAALALAEGDSVATIRHGSADELGDLARAFNRMSVRLRERVADLELERSKLATVLESMAEGVVAVDADERLIHCNAAARAMLSIAPGGAVGGPLVERVRTPELVDALRRAQASGERGAAPLVEEVRMLAAGRERVVSIHAAPLADRGAVAVLLDVTELRRLETVRRDFVANVSHEIKTPLTAMRGLVETLVEDAAMAPDVRRRFLGKLGDQVHRLADLATDLLNLSRAESERPDARVALDLGAAAAAAIERFAGTAASKPVALTCEPPALAVVVPADPEAIAQILDNLLDNAIKYTPAGGRVSVRFARDESSGVIEVADSGIGIEPAEQKRIFERFYRVDKARSRDVPGTGLGLSIVKHLAEAHGGAVDLESWPGRGSTFRVRLPMNAPAARRDAGAAPLR